MLYNLAISTVRNTIIAIKVAEVVTLGTVAVLSARHIVFEASKKIRKATK